MSEFHDFLYNLATVAPGKGQAKKTVSTGLVRLELTTNDSRIEVRGLATDDVVSIYQQVTISLEDTTRIFGSPVMERILHEDVIGYFYPDTLKTLGELAKLTIPTAPPPPDRLFDQKFDQQFWLEHVMSSIFSATPSTPLHFLKIMPDRLRKFSLLKPADKPLEFYMTEWADRTIIRWRYAEGKAYGIYAPIDAD